jgi:hypothetical protein
MILGLCLSLIAVYVLWYIWSERTRKVFRIAKPTNILITGGVQGLGKLLAIEFARNNPNGEVNLIVIDIASHLAD